MEEQLMSLKVDFAFKEIMQNEKVRKGFISAVLQIPVEDIISTTILNTYLRQEHKDDKLGILDIRVNLNGNTEIDIEMQVVPFNYWTERALFYTSKMYIENIELGKKYSMLKKVISISILNFNLLKENYFYNSFHIRNDKTNKLFTDKMEWHTIELLKLPNDIETTNDLLKLWTGFIKESGENKELIKMIATKNEYLQEAYNELEKISANKQKRLEYETRQKALLDYNTLIDDAEKRGQEKGEKIGQAKGEKIGQAKERLEIAKGLLELEILDIETIALKTKLSIDEVKNLKTKLK